MVRVRERDMEHGMNGLLRYAELGAACGLRSMVGPSQLSRHLADLPDGRRPRDATSELLAREPVREMLQIATFGEMVVDKLPAIPDRTDPAPLAGRALLGALSGGLMARARDESPVAGVLLGALGAVAGAFAGHQIRRALTRRAGVPDLTVAVVEDAVAITVARHALRD